MIRRRWSIHPIKFITARKRIKLQNMKSAYALRGNDAWSEGSFVIWKRSDTPRTKQPRQQKTPLRKELKGKSPTISIYKTYQ